MVSRKKVKKIWGFFCRSVVWYLGIQSNVMNISTGAFKSNYQLANISSFCAHKTKEQSKES